MRTPAASNRIRSEVFFAVVGARFDLDFMFAENMLLVLCSTPESIRSRIDCAYLAVDPEQIRIQNFQIRIGSGLRKMKIRTPLVSISVEQIGDFCNPNPVQYFNCVIQSDPNPVGVKSSDQTFDWSDQSCLDILI